MKTLLRKLTLAVGLGAAAMVPVAIAAPAAPAAALYSPVNIHYTNGCVGSSSCYYANLTADRGTFNGSTTIFRAVVSRSCGGQSFGPWRNVANGTTSSYVTVPLGCYITSRGWQTG